MSTSIEIQKLKMIMYRALRWRLQLGDYVNHTPIPEDNELGEFSRGVKCAYRDLLEEIEKIEKAESQFRIWRKKSVSKHLYDESWIDEIKRY